MEKIFIAKLVWQIKTISDKTSCDFDEQLRIVRAENKETAFEKAQKFGLQNQESFLNSMGKNVQWIFVNVEFIKEMISFEDGFEICSQTVNVVDAAQYIAEVNMKSIMNSEVFTNEVI